MSNQDTELNTVLNEDDAGIEIPVHQSPAEAGKEDEAPSYRKAEEDLTMLTQEERTGEEGTGAQASEDS